MRNSIKWRAILAGVLLAGLGCMQAEPTTPPAGARVPVPKMPPPPAPGQPPPPPSNFEVWIAHRFDADVTGKTDEWFEVKTRKGNIYHIVPDTDFAKRQAVLEDRSPIIAYSQVKVGQRLRLHLYYGLPVSVGHMLLGAKPVPPLKCSGALLWKVEKDGNRWPMTDEIIDD
jgi:hypothetical protein